MEEQIFTNEVILDWLHYYAKNTALDLEHVKILDITRKNKNIIPTVESHKTTMVFTNAGQEDIFYRLMKEQKERARAARKNAGDYISTHAGATKLILKELFGIEE